MSLRCERVVAQLFPTSASSLEPEAVASSSSHSHSNSPYRYTIDESCADVLTDEQRASYEKNGFLVVRKLIDEPLLRKCTEHFDDLVEHRAEIHPGMTVMKDIALKGVEKKGERTITKLQAWQDDKVFMEYAKHPSIVKYLACFTGPRIQVMHTMLINKPPDTGKLTSRHPLHQDLWYFPFRPTDRIACAWTAMETINRKNGCLSVIPGSHARTPGGELLQHGYPDWEGGVNHLYHGIKTFGDLDVKNDLVHLEMEAGDTVFFHPLLIHGSGTNRSDGFRKAISVHCCTLDCDWIDMSEGVQSPLVKELLESAEKFTGTKITDPKMANVGWQFRARVLQK